MTDNKSKKPFEGKRTPPIQRNSTKSKYPRNIYGRRDTPCRQYQPKGYKPQPGDPASRIEAWKADKKNAAAVKEIKGLFKFAAQSGIKITGQDMEELLDQMGVTPPVSISEMLYFWGHRR